MSSNRQVTFDMKVANSAGNAAVFNHLAKEAKKLRDALNLTVSVSAGVGAGGGGSNGAAAMRGVAQEWQKAANALHAACREARLASRELVQAANALGAAFRQGATQRGSPVGSGAASISVRASATASVQMAATQAEAVSDSWVKSFSKIGKATLAAIGAFEALTATIQSGTAAARAQQRAREEASQGLRDARSQRHAVDVTRREANVANAVNRRAVEANFEIERLAGRGDLRGAGELAGQQAWRAERFRDSQRGAGGDSWALAQKGAENAARTLLDIQKQRLVAQEKLVDRQRNEAEAAQSIRKTQEAILAAAQGRLKTAGQRFDEMTGGQQRRQLILKDKLAAGKRLSAAELAQARQTGLLDEAIAQGQEARSAANPVFRQLAQGTAAQRDVQAAQRDVKLAIFAEQQLNVKLDVSEKIVPELAKAVEQANAKIKQLAIEALNESQRLNRDALQTAADNANDTIRTHTQQVIQAN